ncbi:GntR family transcriptional regulator [Microbacterium sp.]|uniref:GntR family transcriptional regulator n=1 Tax=Microbacterium sp. TaxID=51671 RepID=UPI0039E62CA9
MAAQLPHRQPALRGLVASAPVYERLRDAILSGELRPNARLIEEDLANALNVSRSPVREALLALVQDGLVVRTRGWAVRDHTPDEVLRIIEARVVMESEAAALAASRITDAQLDELDRLALDMEVKGLERSSLNTLNRHFHTTVTAAAGNFMLDDFARRTNISYWNFNLGVIQPPGDDEIVNRQHRAIIDALRAHDPEAARLAVREHVGRTYEIMSGMVSMSPRPL